MKAIDRFQDLSNDDVIDFFECIDAILVGGDEESIAAGQTIREMFNQEPYTLRGPWNYVGL